MSQINNAVATIRDFIIRMNNCKLFDSERIARLENAFNIIKSETNEYQATLTENLTLKEVIKKNVDIIEELREELGAAEERIDYLESEEIRFTPDRMMEDRE